MRQIWHDIAHAIAKATSQPFVSIDSQPIGGGCINEAYIVHMDGQHWFVKLNSVDKLDMFGRMIEFVTTLVHILIPLDILNITH